MCFQTSHVLWMRSMDRDDKIICERHERLNLGERVASATLIRYLQSQDFSTVWQMTVVEAGTVYE
jgi:hypothetical protein